MARTRSAGNSAPLESRTVRDPPSHAASERIPLTIVAGDTRKGSVTLLVQAVGRTSRKMVSLAADNRIAGLLGPLGRPATVQNFGRVLCVAGGVGVAEVLPGTGVSGGRKSGYGAVRSRSLSPTSFWTLSCGPRRTTYSGLPTTVPVNSREGGVRTLASLNPIMVDGTGMCGRCRMAVGGRVRFACLDGPEFDAHEVDFDDLARRNHAYVEDEHLVLNSRLEQVQA